MGDERLTLERPVMDVQRVRTSAGYQMLGDLRRAQALLRKPTALQRAREEFGCVSRTYAGAAREMDAYMLGRTDALSYGRMVKRSLGTARLFHAYKRGFESVPIIAYS